MTEKNKPPPGYSAFKSLLGKLARVPKAEIKEQEENRRTTSVEDARHRKLRKRA